MTPEAPVRIGEVTHIGYGVGGRVFGVSASTALKILSAGDRG